MSKCGLKSMPPDTIIRGMTTHEKSAFEWFVHDELRGQKVLAALAQELDTEHAKKIFHNVFYVHEAKVAFIAL